MKGSTKNAAAPAGEPAEKSGTIKVEPSSNLQIRNFKKRLKRNGDAVLAVHSPNGHGGGLLVSGSGDNMIIGKSKD